MELKFNLLSFFQITILCEKIDLLNYYYYIDKIYKNYNIIYDKG